MRPRPSAPPLPVWALGLYLSLFLAGSACWYLLTGPPWSEGETSRVVLIKAQTGAFRIADALKVAGIIRSRLAFLAVAAVRGTHHRLLPGEYEFERRVSLVEVLRRLEQGRGLVHQVTIPEGLAARQIADLLAEKGLVDRDRFVELVRDPALLAQSNVEGDSLEGYLFPDTYRMVRGQREEAIIQRMVRRFHEVFGPDEQARAAALGMSVREVVTLASLIEREAHVGRERPLVSAVFHNRLRRGMPLQSDPTVMYALSRFGGRLTRAHLQAPSPYNTYLNQGLPPGPIANPGRASILAALYPARSSYLYFVSKNDGTHAFSKTLRDHDAMVKRYQIGRGG
jgi:UPF0755 protein